MKRQKKFNIFLSILIVINAVIILGLVIWAFFFLGQLKDDAAQKKYRTDLLVKKEQNLSTLNDTYSEVEEDLKLTAIALPEKKDVSKLISDIDQLAKKSGLSITAVRFTTKKGKATSDPSLSQTVKSKNGYELPVELTVEGSYGNFTNFVTQLEDYLRINNIDSFSLGKTSDKDGSSNVSSNLKVTFYLTK